MNLEGITLNILKTHLSAEITGSRVDKVFQPGKSELLLQARNGNKNLFIYISANSGAPHIRLTDKNTINPETPPSFCMLLRKHLESGRITDITQDDLERIITFEIDTLGTGSTIVTKKLVVELTGKSSNIILVQDDVIIDCIKHIGIGANKFRQMLPGRAYISPPPQTGANILKENSASIADAICSQSAPLSSAIIKATVGVGPFTAKEISFRAGLPSDITANTLDIADKNALKEAIESIILPIIGGSAPLAVTSDENGKILALTPYIPSHISGSVFKPFDSVNKAITFILSAEKTAPPESLMFTRIVKNEIQRLQRKDALLQDDLKQAENADELKNTADNLMGHLHMLEKGMTSCNITDFLTNTAVDIKLDTDLTPVENANKYYKLYNKAKRSLKWLLEQIAETKNHIDYLSGIEFSLQNIQAANELAEIKGELKELGLIKEKATKHAKISASIPVKFSLQSGSTVFVGRNNRQNDVLTFKTAMPGDLWFHAKDIPGSHVILKSTGKTADIRDIETAAMLAAWFSKARHSSNVPVDYTLRKYVKKPSGSKPGFVIYENQRTLSVTTDEETIKKIST